MNERKAKKIRKEIYGEMSQKIKREYVRDSTGRISNHPESLRAKYQKIKRQIKKGVKC